MKFSSGIILLLFVVSVSSCNKDEKKSANDIYNTWEVKEFLSVESVLYSKEKNYNPIVEFRRDGTIKISADVNSCFSSYTLISDSGILISEVGCTKICCDSNFSEKFITMVSQVESFSLENNEMKLFIPGWGFIKMELH